MMGVAPAVCDLYLPVELGDPRLAPPSEQELVDLVNDRLCRCERPSEPATCTTEARIVRARYRPSVATLATYAVRDIHGLEHFVTYKAHLGDRAENRVVGGRYGERVSEVCDPLHPFALLPERMASLWVFPADPELRGAVRVLDADRTAAWIGGLGVVPPGRIIPRASTVVLRDYEHSRRAVYDVHVGIRGDGGEVLSRAFVLKILPVEKAVQVALRRQHLDQLSLPIPRLLGQGPERGWILEESVEGDAHRAPGHPAADEVMESLARIHAAPIPEALRQGPKRRLAPMDLLNGIPGIHRVPDWFWRPIEVPAHRWIHGDVHADRALRVDGETVLRSADRFRAGSPEEDVASWAADTIADGGALGLDDTLAKLARHYPVNADVRLDPGRLRSLTAIELMERAASIIVELQPDALLRAARLVSVVSTVSWR